MLQRWLKKDKQIRNSKQEGQNNGGQKRKKESTNVVCQDFGGQFHKCISCHCCIFYLDVLSLPLCPLWQNYLLGRLKSLWKLFMWHVPWQEIYLLVLWEVLSYSGHLSLLKLEGVKCSWVKKKKKSLEGRCISEIHYCVYSGSFFPKFTRSTISEPEKLSAF